MKVGVGDVYIISGQSNAQGLPNGTNDLNVVQPLTEYDGVRVQPVTVVGNGELLNSSFNEAIVDAKTVGRIKPTFLKNPQRANTLSTNEGIGPSGASLWYWAYVGQRIVEAQNVPVAFYNVAWGGTTVKAWAQSTDLVSTPLGRPVGRVNNYDAGTPYRILRAALRLYGATYGVKAVL